LGRRPPLAVLILIGGLSTISLGITLLGTGIEPFRMINQRIINKLSFF